MNRQIGQSCVLAVMLAGSAVVAPGALSAQGGDGFLFREPRVTLEFETGYGWQRAASDLFDQVIADHTLRRRDFDAPYIGGELGVRLSDRFDLAFSVGWQGGSTQSEYRDFIGDDGLPILQTTSLEQVPVVASVKFYPTGRGRQIGRFAWIPRTVAPFVGAGVGVVNYDFEQQGEFIDFATDEIYYDRVASGGSAFLARAQAGVAISLASQFELTFEGRYNWADDPLEGGFVNFQPIDLDGLQAVAGIAVRF